jgi:hypothetical protein
MLTVAIGPFVAEPVAALGGAVVAGTAQPPNAIALAQRPGTT